MEKGRLKPFCVHLSEDSLISLKKKAGDRRVASFIREAIDVAVNDNDGYKAGYNAALRDTMAMLKEMKDIEFLSIRGQSISDLICDQMEGLVK